MTGFLSQSWGVPAVLFLVVATSGFRIVKNYTNSQGRGRNTLKQDVSSERTSPSQSPLVHPKEKRKGGRKSRLIREVTGLGSEEEVQCDGDSKAAALQSRQEYTDVVETPLQIHLDTIGVVRSPYKERFGTPRQANVVDGVLEGKAMQGELVLFDGRGFDRALMDLDGFDFCWVITYMHLNKGWNPKVVPPRGPKVKRGLFSTRSPHRPNSIALSALRVISVDAAKRTVVVDGLDLLDGTPILDIKPYVPYCDAFPDARSGWLDTPGLQESSDRLKGSPPPFIK